MYIHNLKTLLSAAVVGIMVLLMGNAFAAYSGQHKIVNGVTIYLGVMLFEMILGHPKSHTEA